MIHLRSRCLALLAFAIVPVIGCSSVGPDVIDPKTTERTQTSLIAIEKGGGGEILRYSEQSGIVSTSDYSNANGGAALNRVDAIYEQFDSLYLQHRATGEISVLSLKNRKQGSIITGFPIDSAGGFDGMAFSNRSQAWVINYGTPSLYQVDIWANKIVASTNIPLPGNPTCVGTDGRVVFVCTELADGTGRVSFLESNGGGVFPIEKTLDFPSPIVYATQSYDSTRMFFLSSGGPTDDAKPTLYIVTRDGLNLDGSFAIESPNIRSYIGKEPTFAATSARGYIYLGLPNAIVQVDPVAGTSFDLYPGNFPVIGVDYDSDLLYAYAPGSLSIKRYTDAGENLSDIAVPGDVSWIKFISTGRIP
ncbi:MAG: hypothetical protein JWQ98_3679 [Chlorobi bacterium]|nr:hypothetical protein [Chlorobiota bacterium]